MAPDAPAPDAPVVASAPEVVTADGSRLDILKTLVTDMGDAFAAAPVTHAKNGVLLTLAAGMAASAAPLLPTPVGIGLAVGAVVLFIVYEVVP